MERSQLFSPAQVLTAPAVSRTSRNTGVLSLYRSRTLTGKVIQHREMPEEEVTECGKSLFGAQYLSIPFTPVNPESQKIDIAPSVTAPAPGGSGGGGIDGAGTDGTGIDGVG